MFKKIISIILQLFIMILLFIVIVSLPMLFIDGKKVGIHIEHFFSQCIHVISALIHPEELKVKMATQVATVSNNVQIFKMQEREFPLFPLIFKPYAYSLVLIFGALVVSLCLSFVCSMITAVIPRRVQRLIEEVVCFLKIIPDIFLIFFLQLVMVSIYRYTGVLPLHPFSTMQNSSIVLPILILAIIPTISLFQFQMLLIKEEQKKDYVMFVKAKGFSSLYILCKHIVSNIVISVVNHMESILLALITSLFVFEYMFHIRGLFSILISGQDPAVIVYLLMLFIVPMYGVILLLNWLRRKLYA
ncbi:ABC transporter permease subunit [Bacillus sp. TL12]|uniref:ABC transporter permease subunit n=1 Tax=Bacillus sp. TL12 TaxID=2894756 RepID=UPI001F52A13E|nr:ABC transporter permease subunit [Bacillus sp. TL12]MCI0763668.1 ABC transporter permease subunit [Bacillus sp. TL12]